jgi:hypothetical protein
MTTCWVTGNITMKRNFKVSLKPMGKGKTRVS